MPPTIGAFVKQLTAQLKNKYLNQIDSINWEREKNLIEIKTNRKIDNRVKELISLIHNLDAPTTNKIIFIL